LYTKLFAFFDTLPKLAAHPDQPQTAQQIIFSVLFSCLIPPIEGFRDFARLKTCRSEAEIPQRGAYLPERRDLATVTLPEAGKLRQSLL